MQRFTVLVVVLCGVLLSAVITSTPLLAQDKESSNHNHLAELKAKKNSLRLLSKKPIVSPLPIFIKKGTLSASLWTGDGDPVVLGLTKEEKSFRQGLRDSLRLENSKPSLTPFPYKKVSFMSGASVSLLMYQKQLWRNKDTTFFTQSLSSEGYAKEQDVFGHSYGSGEVTLIIGEAAVDAGFPREVACWIGYGYSGLASTLTEVEDGIVRRKGGFSIKDLGSNLLLGGPWGALNVRYPQIRTWVELKISTQPRELKRWVDNDFGVGPKEYERHTYWVIVKGQHLLPKRIGWLSLGIGSTLKDGRRVVKIAPDVDLGRLLSTKWMPRCVKVGINFVHLPFPEVTVN